MNSKAVLLLGLIVVLLISWEVAARDLSETTKEETTQKATEANGVDEAKYGGYPGRGGYGGYPGRGGYGGYPGRGYGGYPYPGRGGYGGGYCRYGCCGGRGYYGGGCRRCCSYLGEAPDAEAEAKPQN
uniref:Glycine-rich protein-like n=1 Tax=Nelumbo nucifera TaxID=4432 RepID=A0A822Y166_NELNU|nr:TPA_asm: hypothetical protein HUJ06_026450 [Nelumbo nucifera]